MRFQRIETPLAFAISASFLLLLGCGDDSSGAESKLGSACKSAGSDCGEGLECGPSTADAEELVCSIPAGEECDPDLDNGGCSALAACMEVSSAEPGAAGAGNEETTHRCLLVEAAECDPTASLCAPEFTCAEMQAGGHRCFYPVVLQGMVSDSSDTSAIEGAHVIGIDDEGVAVTDVAISASDGSYELEIPVARNEDGSPVADTYRLKAAAQDYQAFPSGIRVALPIDASSATEGEGSYVVESALTYVELIPLPAGDRTTVSGSVLSAEESEVPVGGVLVVAAGDAGSFSAISDRSGDYTIFNVPPGSYEVSGYAAFLPLDSSSVSVGSEPIGGVDLSELTTATTTVTGNVQLVNAPGGAVTSIILVVEDTFNPTTATGEVPRGLRAPSSGPPNVDGDFVIEGVPEGRYVVLAAYENDDLVRDPDTNIAGTDFVYLEVTEASAAETPIPESFKVTEALAIFGPGAEEPEAVSSAPLLRWADDSSEDWYDVRVFDALGNEVWTSLALPGVSGEAEVSVEYGGPLEPGMYYQFRVSSWRQPGNGDPAPISLTEDLRGVFYLPAP